MQCKTRGVIRFKLTQMDKYLNPSRDRRIYTHTIITTYKWLDKPNIWPGGTIQETLNFFKIWESKVPEHMHLVSETKTTGTYQKNMITCDAHKLRQYTAKTQSTNKNVTAGKLRNTYQNRKSSQVDYMSNIQNKYTRLGINGHQVDPQSGGILSVHFSLGELRQQQVKIVTRVLKELINTYFHVKENRKLNSYHKPPINFRSLTMSKGRKGGENEPKSGQGAAPPPAAPSLGPPSATPPPKSTTGGTVKPPMAPGDQTEGKRNARAEALKNMEAETKRSIAKAAETKPEEVPNTNEVSFKPAGPSKFPPPKKGAEKEVVEKTNDKPEQVVPSPQPRKGMILSPKTLPVEMIWK